MTVVELIEEIRSDMSRWYAIYKDGEYVTGSHSRHKALEWYRIAKKSRFLFVAKVIKRNVINTKKLT